MEKLTCMNEDTQKKKHSCNLRRREDCSSKTLRQLFLSKSVNQQAPIIK